MGFHLSMDLVWTRRRGGEKVRLSISYNFNNSQSSPTTLFNVIHSSRNQVQVLQESIVMSLTCGTMT